ncbi:hypothetical protein EH221_01300, partial [bacterium]
MPSGIVSALVDYLRQEAESNFGNYSVSGGIEEFLQRWKKEAQQAKLSPIFIDQVADILSDYHNATPQERKQKITAVIDLIRSKSNQKEDSDFKEPRKPSPTPKPNTISIATFSGVNGSGLDAPLTVLHGVGTKNAERLEKLGLFTLNDILHHYPRRYEDYSKLVTIDQLKFDMETTVIGVVESVQTKEIPKRKIKITEAMINDNTGWLRLTWFNQPWLERQLHPQSTIAASGKIENYLGKPVINNPQWEKLDKEQISTNRIVPIYPLTAHMTQEWLRKVIHKVITYWAPKIHDYLPDFIRTNNELIPLSEALLQVHFPDSEELLEKARERLAFDEIFVLQMGLIAQKIQWRQVSKTPIQISADTTARLTQQLPFTLTDAQYRVIQEIQSDLEKPYPMNRLLQGDVGAGKTIIAATAAFGLAHLNFQTAIMAPTSILAEQHFQTLTGFLCSDRLGKLQLDKQEIALLTGDTSKSIREEILEGLRN